MTGLDFMPSLTHAERKPALQGLFDAYIKTGEYMPPPGVTPEATTAATAPVILAAFTAQTHLQSEYGEMLWYSLKGIIPIRTAGCGCCASSSRSPSPATRTLAKQPFYDSFLKRVGLTWAEVAPSPLRGRPSTRALSSRRPRKRGMAQPAVAGPLGEAALGDELRLDPGDVAEARRVVERGVLAPQRLAAARPARAASRG